MKEIKILLADELDSFKSFVQRYNTYNSLLREYLNKCKSKYPGKKVDASYLRYESEYTDKLLNSFKEKYGKYFTFINSKESYYNWIVGDSNKYIYDEILKGISKLVYKYDITFDSYDYLCVPIERVTAFIKDYNVLSSACIDQSLQISKNDRGLYFLMIEISYVDRFFYTKWPNGVDKYYGYKDSKKSISKIQEFIKKEV